MKLSKIMVAMLRMMVLILLLVVVTGNLYAKRTTNHQAKHKQHAVKLTKHNKQKNKHVKKAVSKKSHKKTIISKKQSNHIPRYRHVMNLRAKAFKTRQSSADRAVNNALTFLGTPYSRGGISSRGMDCSGLVYRVMRDMGRNVPHNAAALSNTGIPVSRNQLRKGDLLFFHTTGAKIGHVGIYTSNGNFVHASSGAGRVVVTSLNDEYYSNRLVTARRIFNNGKAVSVSVSSHKIKATKHKHQKPATDKHKHKKDCKKKTKMTKHKMMNNKPHKNKHKR